MQWLKRCRMPAKRRHRGESASYRQCADRWGCPPSSATIAANGKEVLRRPEHGKSCKAPWAYAIDGGMVGGRRQRKVITARTKLGRGAAVFRCDLIGRDPRRLARLLD